MGKLKTDDYTKTTIEIYLSNVNRRSIDEMVDLLTERYDLKIGFPVSEYHGELPESIVIRGAETIYPKPPASDEIKRWSEDRYPHSYAFLSPTVSLTPLLVALIAILLLLAISLWRFLL